MTRLGRSYIRKRGNLLLVLRFPLRRLSSCRLLAADVDIAYVEALEGKRDAYCIENMASSVTATCFTTMAHLVGVVVDVPAAIPFAPISPVVLPPAVVFPSMSRPVSIVGDTYPV